jgi:1-acyl-sn-glycerol-3-phosphate acyltransferase
MALTASTPPAANSTRLAPGGAFAVKSTVPNRRERTPLPQVSVTLQQVFTAYSRWYVGRHFHSLRVSKSGVPPVVSSLPLVIYVNHASWWDPLTCLMLQTDFFKARRPFAPIDAAALRQYRFFAKLGFFGVEQDSRRGAAEFLRTSTQILEATDTVLWLTPQGRFADVRSRPTRFKPGLGHLPDRVSRAVFIPLALEYCHWEERKPEILARFGEPEILGQSVGLPPVGDNWTQHFERRLEATQDALAAEAQARNPALFQNVLRSRSGVGFFYDTWRSLRAKLCGEPFSREHSRL